MNFRQLAFTNVTRNLRSYLSYLFSCILSIFIFFTFSLIANHPEFKRYIAMNDSTIALFAEQEMIICQIVIVLVSLMFLWHTFDIFFIRRKKELTMYMTLGLARRDLKKLLFWEYFFLGNLAIILGIGCGLLFCQLILLIVQNVLHIVHPLYFYVPKQAILLTLVVFTVVFLFLFLLTLCRIELSNKYGMFVEEERDEEMIEISWQQGLLSLLLIVVSYIFILYSITPTLNQWFQDKKSLFIFGIVIGISTLTYGTYCLYKYLFVYFIQRLRKKPLYFQGINMLFLNHFQSRIKQNSRLLFLTTISIIAAFTGIIITMALGDSEFVAMFETSFAYTYQMESRKERNYHLENVRTIDQMITESGYKTKTINFEPAIVSIDHDFQRGTEYYAVIPISQYNDLAKFSQRPLIHLKNNKEIVIFANNKEDKILYGKEKYKVGSPGIVSFSPMAQYYFTDEKEVQMLETSTADIKFSTDIFHFYSQPVALTSDTFYKEMIKKNQEHIADNNEKEDYFYLPSFSIVHFNEWKDNPQLDAKIREIMYDKSQETQKNVNQYVKDQGGVINGDDDPEILRKLDNLSEKVFYLGSLYQDWNRARQTSGMVLLISTLIGIVFFTFAVSAVYVNLFGEITNEGKMQRILHLLGVTKKERNQFVTFELVCLYFSPGLITLIYFVPGLLILSHFMDVFLWEYFIKIFAFYIIFQTIFFFLSRKSYLEKIEKQLVHQF